MAEIGFYHLTWSPLEQALPKLLLKMRETGKHCLLRMGSEERLDTIDRVLWSFDPASWLPHGTIQDGNPETQPILLTVATRDDECQNLNQAAFLVLIDNAPLPDAEQFERIAEMFDGGDPAAVKAARSRWRWAREQGHGQVYWQQNERGGWQRAAASGS